MKLAKLSLAAIMTVGALSTANAQPLEEAIKGVDFNGMIRYNYNNIENGAGEKSSAHDWDFLAKFTAPVTDNVKAVAAFASSNAQNADKTSNGVTTLAVDLRKVFFVYKNDALTFKAGQMAMGTPVTDNGFNGQKGNGAVVMYNAGPVTLAGAYFSGANYMDIDADDQGAPTAGGFDTGDKMGAFYQALNDRDVMAIAAIGSFGPVNAQVWGIKIQDAVDHLVFTQVDGSMAGVTVTGQYINTKLNETITPTDRSGSFYAIKAGYAMDAFSFNAGYTKTDKDMPIHAVTAPADSSVIVGGWRMSYNYPQLADTSVMFLDASAKAGPVTVKLGYAAADIGERTTNESVKEIYGQVSYPIAKNFTTYAKYSDLNDDIDSKDQKYFRFEAKYSF